MAVLRKRRRRNPLGLLLDKPWLVVVGAVLIAFTYWAIGTRNQDHHVRASFSSAFNLVPGQAVSVDGLEVGKIGQVKYDNGKALVEIGINDKQFWPLHEGTKVVSRWGTTIGSGTRRLDLMPGPASEPALKEGGIIATADTQAAVDVDQVLNALNTKVRGHLRSLVANTDTALAGHTKQVNGALHTASGGVEAAGNVLSDLSQDTFALRAFITNTHRLTGAISARAAGVRDLITVASQTFQTFADNTRGTQQSIAQLPATLSQTRSTLHRVDSSVGKLDRLMVALAPGAKRLTPLAAQARPALASLRQTVPTASATVLRTTSAAPNITALMKAADPFVKTAPGVFGDLSPMLACIRPYAPELGGALVGGGGSHQNYDLIDPKLNNQIVRYVGKVRPDGRVEQHGLRATPMVSLDSIEKPLNSAQNAALTGKLYAYPRPPGLTAGQPWFLPDCGITKDALDPSKDPEAAK
jgi:ABC-type transporter Mla subunit MlaD